ncbi:Phosphoglucomutase-2 [Phlyctochytrium bullatum]|nr:Phosphoglucomutase-2 [Phlyctochytrium bullatum]
MENYTENFVQSILSAIPGGAEGATLVVGGDGRYYGKDAVRIIIKLAAGNRVDLNACKINTFDGFTVEVVDSVEDYVLLMKEIYDFTSLKAYFSSHPEFKVLIDSMHGVTGPYVERIFVKELGLPASAVMNTDQYAHDLVERVEKEFINFGAASDGDGDRNMIIGKGVFVNPSDSVAAIASYAKKAIPYFQKTGIKELHVQKALKFSKFRLAGRFCYLDVTNGLIAWLSIIDFESKTDPNAGLKNILLSHYRKYGRNFFSRYDYEEVDSKGASEMFKHLENLAVVDKAKTLGLQLNGFTVSDSDNFTYTDPIDGSVSKNQGIRIIFSDGSRVIFRLSGTGSQGATIRLYVEKYSNDPSDFELETQTALKGLIDAALSLSKLKEFVGRDEPTVIT